MKKSITIAVCLLGVAGINCFVQADDDSWVPPGPPGPTMVSLQTIYDKLDECCSGGGPGDCGVPKTGQMQCWDQNGVSIDCAGTGQDGEYQAGSSVDPRFTDNGDGTVTDNLSGLIWLKDANCFGGRLWIDALSDANTLANGSCGLTDGSVAGDWRLPNVRELQTLVDYSRYNVSLPAGHPFTAVQAYYYWSSSTFAETTSRMWTVRFNFGDTSNGTKSANYYTWPVRGGL